MATVLRNFHVIFGGHTSLPQRSTDGRSGGERKDRHEKDHFGCTRLRGTDRVQPDRKGRRHWRGERCYHRWVGKRYLGRRRGGSRRRRRGWRCDRQHQRTSGPEPPRPLGTTGSPRLQLQIPGLLRSLPIEIAVGLPHFKGESDTDEPRFFGLGVRSSFMTSGNLTVMTSRTSSLSRPRVVVLL